MPAEQEGAPLPALEQEVEPVLRVKKPSGQGWQAVGTDRAYKVVKVLRGQGLGVPEPAGQKEPGGQGVPVQAWVPTGGE